MADKNLSKFEKERLKEKEKFAKDREKWQKKDTQSRTKKKTKFDLTSIVFKALAILVVAGIVLGVGVLFATSYGFPERLMPVVTVAGTSIRVPEYTNFFWQEFAQHHQVADQMHRFGLQLGGGLTVGTHFGLDPTAHPFGQRRTGDDTHPNMNWGSFMHEQTNIRMQNIILQYNEAVRLGLTLTEDQQEQIDDFFIDLMQEAAAMGFTTVSVNSWLRMSQGPGVTRRSVTRSMERAFMIENFIEHKTNELREGYSAQQLREQYEQDTTLFDFVDLRVQPFVPATVTREEGEGETAFTARQAQAREDARQQAETFLAGVNDSESFVVAAQVEIDDEDVDATAATARTRARRSALDERYILGEETLSDWAFDAARQTGDTVVFEITQGFQAVMLVRPAYALNLVDFYSFSVPIPTAPPAPPPATPDADEDADEAEENDDADTDEDADDDDTPEFDPIADAYDQAQAVAQRWEERGEADAAAELLEGIRPGILALHTMEDWVLAHGRQVGDVGIVPIFNEQGTQIAYEVMMIAAIDSDNYSWMEEIRDELTEADYFAFMEDLRERYPARVRPLGTWMSMAVLDEAIVRRIEEYNEELAREDD